MAGYRGLVVKPENRFTVLVQAFPTRRPINAPVRQARRLRDPRSTHPAGGDRPVKARRVSQPGSIGRQARKGRQPTFASVLATMSTLSLLLGSVAGIGVSQVLSGDQPAQRDSVTVAVPSPDLRTQMNALFATPDSLGSIAVGVAEGTRTLDGSRTEIWAQHTDPGNHAINQGTFAWQLEADSPEAADQKAIARILNEAVPHLLQEADRAGMALNLEQLMQGIDLWNQAPSAGADFVENLKRCQQQGQLGDTALLCARMQSFYNATTGDLEASGFENDPVLLEQDQSRRIAKIQQVLALRAQNQQAQ